MGKIVRLMTTFVTGQLLIQALNFGTGLLLLRWLSVAAYAQYSVAFSIQTSLNQLVDMGFAKSIVALVGERGHDPHVIGGYLQGARHYRLRSFAVLSVASALFFPFILRNQDWSPMVKVSLWASVVASVFLQGQILYGSPLLIRRKIREYYNGSIASGSFRLSTSVVLHFLSALTGPISAWINAFSLGIQGLIYRKAAEGISIEPPELDQEKCAEIRQFVNPLWPTMVYSALQSQINIALISYFGKTHNIAEVAALGRLSQLFLLFSAMNGVLVEPYFANLHRNKLVKHYLYACALSLFIGVFLTGTAYVFPDVYLLLLGKNYSNLRAYIGPSVLSACLTYVQSVIYTIHNSRKWVFWSSSIFAIVLALVVQTVSVMVFNLSSTMGIINLGIAYNVAVITSTLVAGAVGWIKHHKEGVELKVK